MQHAFEEGVLFPRRIQFDSGMVRDHSEGKMRPDLVRDGPMLLRWIKHLTRGAKHYSPRNWMLASGPEEYDRALESVDRHYTIWYTWMRYGVNIEDAEHPTTTPLQEDHAAAVFFNINLAEHIKEKQHQNEQTVSPTTETTGPTHCEHG